MDGLNIKSVECPNCGELADAMYVGNKKDGWVYTNHECEFCDKEFKPFEVQPALDFFVDNFDEFCEKNKEALTRYEEDPQEIFEEGMSKDDPYIELQKEETKNLNN